MGESLKDYPQGRGAPKSRYIKNTLVEFGLAKGFRNRYTVAQLNLGQVLLPALPGVKWRGLAFSFIAVGGNAATATSVKIQGTQATTVVDLWTVTIAALTRSAQIFSGVTPAAGAQTILADGASYAACDANTAVNLVNVGSAMATLTAIDVFVDYVADPQ